jgi:hypothetical protein
VRCAIRARAKKFCGSFVSHLAVSDETLARLRIRKNATPESDVQQIYRNLAILPAGHHREAQWTQSEERAT